MKKPKPPKEVRNPSWPPPVGIMEWEQLKAMLRGDWKNTGLPGEGK